MFETEVCIQNKSLCVVKSHVPNCFSNVQNFQELLITYKHGLRIIDND